MGRIGGRKLWHEINAAHLGLIGRDKVKRQIARETGIPTTKSGMEKKIGRTIINAVFGRKSR